MFNELRHLLQHREAIIADHSFRERDPAGHLDALREISEKLTAWASAHQGEIDAKLRHYLTNASYQKALAHLDQP